MTGKYKDDGEEVTLGAYYCWYICVTFVKISGVASYNKTLHVDGKNVHVLIHVRTYLRYPFIDVECTNRKSLLWIYI